MYNYESEIVTENIVLDKNNTMKLSSFYNEYCRFYFTY